YRQDERGRLEQAKIDGLKEGEKKGKIDTALKMLQKKYAAETIADLTGLSPDEISRLAQSLSESSNG
ncbi:MAG TPA: hypothetical protein DHW82_00850, partial [Spirochaetia bacterium]|nr:hypothetical protein [Spirochaetia bacterium]